MVGVYGTLLCRGKIKGARVTESEISLEHNHVKNEKEVSSDRHKYFSARFGIFYYFEMLLT